MDHVSKCIFVASFFFTHSYTYTHTSVFAIWLQLHTAYIEYSQAIFIFPINCNAFHTRLVRIQSKSNNNNNNNQN